MSEKQILKLRVNDQEVSILQRKDMFCASLDSILLTNFIKIGQRTNLVLDFGTNNGIIAILLAIKFKIKVIGIEIQKEAVELAKLNLINNNLSSQVTVVHQDLHCYALEQQNASQKKADAIVCNPPFFKFSNQTKTKLAPMKVIARHEVTTDLATIIKSAASLLKIKGKLFMIYNTERLDDLVFSLKANQFAIKRLQMIFPKIDKPASVFLIEAVYKANQGLIVCPPIVCHNPDNSYVSEIAKWYNNNNAS